jgi:hypothetical protein
MINKSQYLKNGEWVDGHEAIYVEDPTAQVGLQIKKQAGPIINDAK